MDGLPDALPNNPFPSENMPFPMPTNGLAIFISSAAENTEERSAAAPPGSSFPAFLTRFPSPSVILELTASKSKPSPKPLAKEAPMLAPSSIVLEMSIPKSVRMPALSPEPIPLPMEPEISASFAFPVPFHHSMNGSVINSSHAIFTFPKKSASCHSCVCTSSPNSRFISSTRLSTPSIRLSKALSSMGMESVSHWAIPPT